MGLSSSVSLPRGRKRERREDRKKKMDEEYKRKGDRDNWGVRMKGNKKSRR